MLVPLFLLVLVFVPFLLLWLLPYLNTFIVVFGFRCFFLLTFAVLLFWFCCILLIVVLVCFLVLFFVSCFRLILLLVVILVERCLVIGPSRFQRLENLLFFLLFDGKIHLLKPLDLMIYRILVVLSVFDVAFRIFVLNLLYHLVVKEFRWSFSLIIILFFVIHLVELYHLKKNSKFLNFKNFVDSKKMT